MKKIARKIVASILGYQVRQLYKQNEFKVIGVVGSIGKTSTKLAVAEVLKAGYKVRYQEGNYNDLVTVPLVFFGEQLPSLLNPLAWTRTFWRNNKQLRKAYPYDVVVLELGSDGPGQIAEFSKYLKLEMAIVTAITPEHMLSFKTLEEVAKEELSVSAISSLMLINKDLCDSEYLEGLGNKLTYARQGPADFVLADFNIDVNSIPEQYSQLAAAAAARKLGMDDQQIKEGLKNIKPFSGRMQLLQGINGSSIMDDSYNASPMAVKLALDTLYSTSAPYKIALLGNMNELGDMSPQAHREIGYYCDPAKLDLVITLGPEANQFLAPSAREKGLEVKEFSSPYDAGEFLKQAIKPKSVVLVKGSQNSVFAEEAIKPILENPDDVKKLVRQSPQWLEIKRKAFKK